MTKSIRMKRPEIGLAIPEGVDAEELAATGKFKSLDDFVFAVMGLDRREWKIRQVMADPQLKKDYHRLQGQFRTKDAEGRLVNMKPDDMRIVFWQVRENWNALTAARSAQLATAPEAQTPDQNAEATQS